MNSTVFDLTGRISNPRSLTLKAISLLLHQSADRRLVYRLRASTWQPVDWGFIPSRVILKTLKIVFAAFVPGARHKRKCEGFCVSVVRHVMSLNSVQSFVIENCNGPTIENGLSNVCLHPLSRTFTFTPISRLPIRHVDVRILENSRGNSSMSNFTFCIL